MLADALLLQKPELKSKMHTHFICIQRHRWHMDVSSPAKCCYLSSWVVSQSQQDWISTGISTAQLCYGTGVPGLSLDSDLDHCNDWRIWLDWTWLHLKHLFPTFPNYRICQCNFPHFQLLKLQINFFFYQSLNVILEIISKLSVQLEGLSHEDTPDTF